MHHVIILRKKTVLSRISITTARCVACSWVAREIETLSVYLYLSPCNATQRNAQP